LEVLRMVEKISAVKINYDFTECRPGDPAVLIASSELAKKELGWNPEYADVESIVKSEPAPLNIQLYISRSIIYR